MRRLTTSRVGARSRSSTGRTTALCLFAALAWSSSTIASRADASEPVDFAVTTIDGRLVRSDDYRGRWLLVNYWATWCDGCVKEMPVLSRLVDREPRLAVLGITDEKLAAAALEAFVAAHPVSYAIAHVDRAALPTGLPPTAFGVAVRPISYLVGPDGRVVERFIGEVDPERLQRQIDGRPR